MSIKVVAWDPKNEGSDGVYYIKGVNGNWREGLKNHFAGEDSPKGDLVVHQDPRQKMIEMNIKFDFIEKRGTQNNNSNNHAGTNAGAASQTNQAMDVSLNGTAVIVKGERLRTDTQLKDQFKQQFGAKWDKNNKHWYIQNGNLANVQAFFNNGEFVNQQSSNNYSANATNQSISPDFVIPKEQAGLLANLFAALSNGQTIRVQ